MALCETQDRKDYMKNMLHEINISFPFLFYYTHYTVVTNKKPANKAVTLVDIICTVFPGNLYCLSF